MSKPAQAPSLREAMPFTTAIIDDLRAAFGRDEIDEVIKSGIRGAPVFYAQEGGREIGTRSPAPTVVVSCADIELIVEKPAEEMTTSRRRRAA